jgi:NADH:ubiquinone oxidoreductase subunit 4 (subunit M)
MIAHGFVVVGLFYAAEIIFRRYETRAIAEMGGIRTQSPKFTSMFLILVLASFCQLLLTLLENSPFCTVFHKLIFGLPF